MSTLPTALLFLASGLSTAQVSESGFEDALAQVETLLEVGRWAQAKRTLLEELERREGDALVAARLTEVQEILLRCSFGVAHPPLQPSEVVSGDVLRFDAARGEIHLRYRPAEAGAGADFVEVRLDRSVLVHPLEWNGPYSIRVDTSGADGSIVVIVCGDLEANYFVQLDEYLALVRVPTVGEDEILGEPVRLAELAPRSLEVRVGARTLEVLLDGESRIAAEKPAGLFGPCGLLSFAGIESLELEGRAELAWVQNKIDDAAALARLEYERDLDPKSVLPAWLRPFDMFAAAQAESEAFADPFAGFPDAPRGVIERARALLEEQDRQAGREFAEGLGEEQAGARLLAWLRGMFLLRAGRRVEARDAAEAAFELQRDDLHTRREWVLQLLDSGANVWAIAAAEAMLAEFPDRPAGHEALASALIRDGRREEAALVLRRAAEAGVRSYGTQALERMLVRARRGPAWARTFEYGSRHYVVRSDISRELCLLAAQELDGAHRMFEMRLGRIETRPDERLPVYLFSGRGTYLLYTRDLTGSLPVHTAGMYSPLLQQLLIWNLPVREEMLRTVRHEGFHQFLERRVGEAPVWMHEGLAEYYSASRIERGRWSHGEALEQHLDVLRKPGFAWTPLEELLRLDAGTFYDGGGRYYAEAWHWVHFLEHSSVQNGRRMRALVDALASGESEQDALEAAFPAADLPDLDAARRQHLARP